MKQQIVQYLMFLANEKYVRNIALFTVAFLLFSAATAHAGTTGTEFLSVYDKIKDLTTGYLGKTLALSAFLIGLGAGAFKGSPMPAVAGIGIAAFTTYGVPVLESLSSGMLP